MFIIGNKDGSIIKKEIPSDLNPEQGFLTYNILDGGFAIVHDKYDLAFKIFLGSSVAILFYDLEKKIKGLCHFLLPSTNKIYEDTQYGLYTLEIVLNSMYKLGCKKENLNVKIIGGSILNPLTIDLKTLVKRNIQFINDFCLAEKIEIVSNDTGGSENIVLLCMKNFETDIKIVNNSKINDDIMKRELNLQNELNIRKPALSECCEGTQIFGIEINDENNEFEIF